MTDIIEPWVTSAPALDSLTRESWEITSREAWAERRGKDVTASNIACLFEGADEYATIDQLVDHVQGTPKRREQTAAMRAGVLLEHIFPAAVAEERPELALKRATTYHRLPEFRLGVTPDFWIRHDFRPPLDQGVCETKTISERRWQGRPLLTWTLQLQTQMIVTGVQWGVLAVIVRGDTLPLYLFEATRHPDAEAKILAAVANFWRKYDAGEFPVPAPADEIAAMLDDGSHIDLSDDPRLPEWLAHREELVETRSDCERRIKQYDYEIKQRMGQASTAWLPGWELSWKSQHRKEFTVKAQDIRVLRVKRTQETDDE